MNGQAYAGYATYDNLSQIGQASTNQLNQMSVPGPVIGATGYNMAGSAMATYSSFQIQTDAINRQLQQQVGQEYADYQRRSYNFDLMGIAAMPILGAIGGAFAGGPGAVAGYAAGAGLMMALPSMAAEFGFLQLPESVTIEEQTKALMSEAVYGAAWSTMDPFTTRGLRGTSVLQAQDAAEELYSSMRSQGFQGAELSRLMPALQSIGAFSGTDNIDEMVAVAEQYISSIRDFISRTNAMMEDVVALVGVGGMFGLEGAGIENYLQSISRGAGASNMAPADFAEDAAMSAARLVGLGDDLTGVFEQYALTGAYTRGAARLSNEETWGSPFTPQEMAKQIAGLGIGRFTGSPSGMAQATAMSVSPGALDDYLSTGYVGSEAYNDYWDLSPTERYKAKYNVGEFLANNSSSLYLGDVSRIMNLAPDFGGDLEAGGAYLAERLNAEYNMGMTPVQGRNMLETYDFQRSISGQAQTWEYMTLVQPYEEKHQTALSEMTERIYRGLVGTQYITNKEVGWGTNNPWYDDEKGLKVIEGSRNFRFLSDDELSKMDANLIGLGNTESISYLVGREEGRAVDLVGLMYGAGEFVPNEQRMLTAVMNNSRLYRKTDNGDVLVEGVRAQIIDGEIRWIVSGDGAFNAGATSSVYKEGDDVTNYVTGATGARFGFRGDDLTDALAAITVGSYTSEESWNYANRYGVAGTLDEYIDLNFELADFERTNASGARNALEPLLLAQATQITISSSDWDFGWVDLRGRSSLDIARGIAYRKFGTTNISSLSEGERNWVASFVTQKYNRTFDLETATDSYTDFMGDEDIYSSLSTDQQKERMSNMSATDQKTLWDYFHGIRSDLPLHLRGVVSAMGLTNESGAQVLESAAHYQYRTALTAAETLIREELKLNNFNIEDAASGGIEGTALANYSGDNKELLGIIDYLRGGITAQERPGFISSVGHTPVLDIAASGSPELTDRTIAENTMNYSKEMVDILNHIKTYGIQTVETNNTPDTYNDTNGTT